MSTLATIRATIQHTLVSASIITCFCIGVVFAHDELAAEQLSAAAYQASSQESRPDVSSRLASIGALSREVDFHIPKQPLASALLSFSDQTQLQVISAGVDVVDVTTPGVTGRRPIADALRLLLGGTGLKYTALNDYTISIHSNEVSRISAVLEEVTEGEKDKPSENPNGNSNENPENSDKGDKLAEVVVTGTHIRGLPPVGVNLITIGRDDIERSGFNSAQEIVRSLPQNFGGGVSEDTYRNAASNTQMGTALNLRGLGSGATLVLVNGRRMAASGENADFFDVSTIPVSAIERVEVLLDGASAIYGSDAVGGVVNYVLRSTFSGAETQGRVGTVTQGGARDYRFAQSVGGEWATGNGLVSYEFNRRDRLRADSRIQTANSDLRGLGGNDYRSPMSQPGNVYVGADAWAIPSGQDGSGLSAADLLSGTTNLENPREGTDSLPEQTRHSLFVMGRQALGTRATLALDGFFAQREMDMLAPPLALSLFITDTNPFYVNPAGGTDPVIVAYSFRDDFGPNRIQAEVDALRLGVTASAQFASDWTVEGHGSYASEKMRTLAQTLDFAELNLALSDSNPDTAFNAFGDGSYTNIETLERIRGVLDIAGESDLQSFSLHVNGDLVESRAGDLRLAVGADQRRSTLRSSSRQPGFQSLRAFEREVFAAFTEVLLDVKSSWLGSDAAHLSLSMAARHEDYSDFGNATVPKVGIHWFPVAGFALRGSWGKSFKAPNLLDLDETNNFSLLQLLPDPLSSTGTSTVMLWGGKNSDLSEERATTWSVGVDLISPLSPQTQLSLTYFDTSFTDKILLPEGALSFGVLLDPLSTGFVLRNPSQAQLDLVCNRSTFFSGLPSECFTSTVAAIVDARVANLSKVSVRGIDAMATHVSNVGTAKMSYGLNLSYLLEHSEASHEGIPSRNTLNLQNHPIDLRIRGSLGVSSENAEATVFVNFASAYRDEISQPARRISPWTTVDAHLGYHIANHSIFDNSSVSLNIMNLFDENPPFLNNPDGIGYDPENADIMGRTISLSIRKLW